MMRKSQNTTNEDPGSAAESEALNKAGTLREQARNGSGGTKPQAGRPPNRPPYEQHLRVTKAFQK
jgi:hypothetical protein